MRATSRVRYNCGDKGMPTLYGIIADLRREHQTPSAAKTLDMLTAELGRTQDNLRTALARLPEREVPTGGNGVLEELARRARAAGVDNVSVPISPEERSAAQESIGSGQIGIAVLLGLSTLVPIVLAAVAIFVAVK